MEARGAGKNETKLALEMKTFFFFSLECLRNATQPKELEEQGRVVVLPPESFT